MPQTTADVVIIGAGINGAATAYNLLRKGVKRVLVLERHLLASGGTGRSAAIIRQHYSNEELVRMVRRSVELFSQFDAQIGGDCGFVNTGWAFLTPQYVSDGFARNLALGQRLGVQVREITRDELRALDPRIDLSDVARIAYEPGSGYADPIAATHAYLKRVIDLGGELRTLTPATGLAVSGGKIKGVRTAAGDISCAAVLNAAGPWADRVAAWAGVKLPLMVTREEEVIFETAPVGGGPRLCFSDMAKAIYYRPHGRSRMLVGRGYPKEYEQVDPDHHRALVNESFIEELSARVHQRWPSFTKALPIDAYTGLYDVTPDWHPVLGRVESVEGLYLCAGFSGHGFKIGPAVGELMAEEIVDGKASSIPIARFNVSRFERGETFTAAYGGNRA